MIRAGFLDAEAKRDPIELARDGSVEHRLRRRANALLLLNNGMSCAAVAKVLFIDDDTVRTWHRLYEDGIEGLAGFGHEGSSCRLNLEQQDKLKAWIGETLPRSTRQIGTYIEKEFKIAYEGRSGLIALLHRLGMEHRKPQAIPRKLDEAKQEAFIEKYNALLNALPEDEAVMFGRCRSSHPHGAARRLLGATRRAGCGRTKQRPRPAEHPRRHRPGNRQPK